MKKNVVVVGGGTGTYTLLSGLKKYPFDLSAIVSMMDSGGSNRIIRDEFGLLPTSDLRQCIVALASEGENEIIRQLFTYRYNHGTGIKGMTFGNLFMAALTDIYGSQDEAIQKTCELLDVTGAIIPVTFDNTNLVAKYDNGKQVLGEHYIDEPEGENASHSIVELSVFPPAQANPKALHALKKADYIALGPGDLFTSTLSNVVISGVAEAIAASKAQKVYVMNLMTRKGQTTGFKASDHLNTIKKYLGVDIDIVIINSTPITSQEILMRYEAENAYPVVDDLGDSFRKIKIVRADVVSNEIFEKPSSDTLTRSLIRHDSDKLAKVFHTL